MRAAGGIPIVLPLDEKTGFEVNAKSLNAAVTSRTRAILFNTPHNPTGHVATPREMAAVAKVAIEHDLVVISDEVYEGCIYPGAPAPHTTMASVAGMRDRTLTIGSSGKLFSCTGWRVGWAVGAADLVKGVSTARSFTSFCAPTPLQEAVAKMLDAEQGEFDGIPGR